MGANRYEAESKLRRIAVKLLVTAIRQEVPKQEVTISCEHKQQEDEC